jgi:hypothetical protein
MFLHFPGWKYRQFDTIEVNEAKSQAMLITLTEHNFQEAFKNGRSIVSGPYVWKWTTWKVKVVTRPKVSFGPDESNSPRKYSDRTQSSAPLKLESYESRHVKASCSPFWMLYSFIQAPE